MINIYIMMFNPSKKEENVLWKKKFHIVYLAATSFQGHDGT